MLCQDSKLHRFKLIVKPDLSDVSLRVYVINASDTTLHNFNFVSFLCYRICEDTLVSCWIDHYQSQRELGPASMVRARGRTRTCRAVQRPSQRKYHNTTTCTSQFIYTKSTKHMGFYFLLAGLQSKWVRNEICLRS